MKRRKFELLKRQIHDKERKMTLLLLEIEKVILSSTELTDKVKDEKIKIQHEINKIENNLY